jgi:hypothetical protein
VCVQAPQAPQPPTWVKVVAQQHAEVGGTVLQGVAMHGSAHGTQLLAGPPNVPQGEPRDRVPGHRHGAHAGPWRSNVQHTTTAGVTLAPSGSRPRPSACPLAPGSYVTGRGEGHGVECSANRGQAFSKHGETTFRWVGVAGWRCTFGIAHRVNSHRIVQHAWLRHQAWLTWVDDQLSNDLTVHIHKPDHQLVHGRSARLGKDRESAQGCECARNTAGARGGPTYV